MRKDIYQAINLCITKGIPFVAYQHPNQSEVEFFSNPTGQNNPIKFYISFFSQKDENPLTIYCELNSIETIFYCNNINTNHKPKIKPFDISTDFESYEKNINNIVSILKESRGKVVISKVICEEHRITDWANIAKKYFCNFDNTFRYIYYTPQTGCWLGASPEIIISKEANSEKYKTMALAGTRIKNSQSEWDSKNIAEHNYVTDYIINSMKELGLTTIVHDAENVSFGDIEHLCHRIEIHENKPIAPITLATHLSPTPALAGYPLTDALSLINKFENHQRLCYGGFIALETEDKFCAYVNLRCVHFDQNNFCIYSGGGITKDSNAKDEWRETELKISKLKDILS